MLEIQNIVDAIALKHVKITDHADEEMADDGVLLDQVYDSVRVSGEIIEEYEYTGGALPRCLILGHTGTGQSLHTVWGL